MLESMKTAQGFELESKLKSMGAPLSTFYVEEELPGGETVTYALGAAHWHTRGEHRIGGLSSDIELHLVHQVAGSQCYQDLMVVGVMFEVVPNVRDEHLAEHRPIDRTTPKNKFLESNGWDHLPRLGGHTHITPDFSHLSALHGDFFAYDGSLTTGKAAKDDCDPGELEAIGLPSGVPVKWRVMKKVEKISFDQLQQMVAALSPDGAATLRHAGPVPWEGNWRPVQPLGDRTIVTCPGVARM